MYKIAVLGDYNSIYGFAALGLDTFPVEDPAEGKETLMPAIIQIPGIAGNTGAGIENVKKSVETAVGSDILFSNE